MKRKLIYLAVVLAAMLPAAQAQHQTERVNHPVIIVRAPNDGVADAGPQIQAVINNAPAFSEIVLPKGTYAIGTGGISLASRSNLTIRGHGAKLKPTAISALTIANLGATMMKLDLCTNVKVTGLEIDNNSIAHAPIGLNDCTECEISYCKVYSGNTVSAHIASLDGIRNRYLYNQISGGTNAVRGLWIGNTNNDVEDDPLVQGNYIRNTPATCIAGVVTGGIYTENYCIDSAGAGFALAAVAVPNNFRRAVISNNVCRGNTFHGIQSDASADYSEQISIVGNICEENDGTGIYAVRMRDSLIANNICRDNNVDGVSSGHGIQVETAKRIVVSGNLCYDSRSGASRTQGTGINVSAPTNALDIEDVLLVGNFCRNNLAHGLAISNAGTSTVVGASVIGNYCVDNGSRGLIITDVAAGDLTEITVGSNHCMGNTSNDIQIEPLDAVIFGNRYSTQSGIEHTFTDLDTTPSVKGRREFVAANTGATVITNFDDGVIGQEIIVRATNGNTTINNTANTLLTGAANIALTANSAITLRKISSTVWIETARSIK